MRCYFDVEYYDANRSKRKSKKGIPILVSIGIVRDGAELHLVNGDFEFTDEMKRSQWWFYKNVWKSLEQYPRAPFFGIAAQVKAFLQGCTLIVTREGGFDRTILEHLIGELPAPYCDIEVVWHGFGKPKLPPREPKSHVAIEDARWHQTMFNHVLSPVLRAA